MENQVSICANDTTYCSFPTVTNEDKMALYNAINNPQEKLKAKINMILEITQVYCSPIELTNEKTGELAQTHRIILMDKDGVTYSTVSVGVFESVKNIMLVFGTPENWEKPLKVKVVQMPTNNGANQILKLELVLK